MSIATAISAAQERVANAYTAISAKGGTLPATQNLANMPTAIQSIPSGSSEIPSYQIMNGVITRYSDALTGNEFSNITEIDSYGMCYAFYKCTGLTGTLDLSALTSIGYYGMSNAFQGCTGLTGTLDLSALTSVGNSGMSNAFQGCTGLTGALNLSALTTIGSNGMRYAFYGCSGLTSVNLSAVTTIGSYGMQYAFYGCTELKNIYFRALTTTSFGTNTNQFNNMMYNTGTTKTHTLHFPSNLESTISGLSGYPTFGGTSGYVVCAFDLPATDAGNESESGSGSGGGTPDPTPGEGVTK